MEDIKVNEYVRTPDGEIGIVERFEYEEGIANPYTIKLKGQNYAVSYEEKIKHSPNIIDLIEEGDYVNGKRVSTIQESKDTSNNIIIKELWCYFDLHFCSIIREDKIKNIVTKEQFNSIKYEV